MNKNEICSVAIVDNDPLALKILTKIVAETSKCQILWTEQSGGFAIQHCQNRAEVEPDILILDISLNDIPGYKVAQVIHSSCSKLSIIGVTAFNINQIKTKLYEYPFTTILSKDKISITLPKILLSIKTNQETDTNQNEKRNGTNTSIIPLSKREYLTLQLCSQGYSTKEIAEKMQISLSTVQTNIQRSLKKIHARNISNAIYILSKNNLL